KLEDLEYRKIDSELPAHDTGQTCRQKRVTAQSEEVCVRGHIVAADDRSPEVRHHRGGKIGRAAGGNRSRLSITEGGQNSCADLGARPGRDSFKEDGPARVEMVRQALGHVS